MMLKTVLLDEKEYYVIEEIKLDEEYYILANTIDNLDICIRKKIKENDQEYLVGLSDEKEYNLVMEAYKKKVEK